MSKPWRATRWTLKFILALGIIYLLCFLFPQPFFRHHSSRGNITVYLSTAPSPKMETLLEEVSTLLNRSAINDSETRERVFLCSSLSSFQFFSRGRSDLGGLCDDRLTGNIFIRPADLEAGRLQPPPGWPYGADPRPLSYFIAHEIVHNLEARYAGRWNLKVPVWLWEGYADYIGKGPQDFWQYLTLYASGSNVMDPSRGQYDRYQLYVMYLLDRQHENIRTLLDHPPALQPIEDSLRRLSFAKSSH